MFIHYVYLLFPYFTHEFLFLGLLGSLQEIQGSAAAFAARTRGGRVVTWGHRNFGGWDGMGCSLW